MSYCLWNQEIYDVLNVFQNTVRSYDNASAAAVHFTFPPSGARRKCTHSSAHARALLCCTAGAAAQTFNKASEFLKNVTIFNQFVFIPTVTPPALLLGK